MEKRSLKIILSKCWLLLQLLLLYIWSTTIFDSLPAVQCPPLKLAQISILPIHFEKGNPLFLLNRYIKYRILNSNLLKCDFVAGRSDENDVSQVKRWNYKMINVCKVIIHKSSSVFIIFFLIGHENIEKLLIILVIQIPIQAMWQITIFYCGQFLL